MDLRSHARRPLMALAGSTALAALIAAWQAAAEERERHDHDRAREALRQGEVLPLAEVLARVRPEMEGEVVGIALEHEHGQWLYAFRVVNRDGRRSEVHVDARTARLLRRGDK